MHGRELSLEDLAPLGELGWVRGMALRLLADPNDADDIAQEAWLKARVAGIGRFASRRSLRAWLATVTRRMVRDLRRSRRQRAARELRVARGEAAAEDLVERSALVQALLYEVGELGEPYRSTVLLRYMDGRSTPEMAAALSVSEDVVRKRLSRGLARLRERLARRWGDAAPACLLGLARIDVHVAAPPEISFGAKLTAAAGVAACGLIGARAWIQRPEVRPPGASGDALAPPARSEPSGTVEATAIRHDGGDAQPTAERPPLESRAPESELQGVRVYQIEQDGRVSVEEFELELRRSVPPSQDHGPPAED